MYGFVLSLKSGNCVNLVIFFRMIRVGFHRNNVEVTVYWSFLSVSSHKVSLSSLLVLVGGFHLV
jgi:hypothetical protein